MCATTATSKPCSPKKTVIFYGSPRENGATAKVLSMLSDRFFEDAVVVNCYERAVTPCDDCRGCYAVMHCVKRDMDDVYEAIEHAERLVFLSPVYNRSFPAPMKAMIDRLQWYWAKRFIHGVHVPIAKPKTAWIVTVCGSDRDDGTCLQFQLEPQLTVLHVTQIAAVHIKNSDSEIDWFAVEQKLKQLS